jgi:protein-S-isoprenylcysteine O-methyltransferase Ste14
MHAVVLVIGFGWVIFWFGWMVAAFTAKDSRGPRGWYLGLRVLLIVVVVNLIRLNWHKEGGPALHASLALSVAGLVVWAAGLGLAVWARLYIGRNWGMPMTRRSEPELVTTGPYRTVRHPIYTGIIAALIGTALATSLLGLIVAAAVAGFFTFSAVREERFLTGEFPDSYPAYKARTKMLVPFVF